MRRLIVAAARGLVVKPPKARAAPGKPIISGQSKGSRQRRIAFQLFDPRQRFTTSYRYRRHPIPPQVQRLVPRIRVIDVGFDPRSPLFRNAASAAPPPPPPPEVDDTVSAMRLSRRLAAIKLSTGRLAASGQALCALAGEARRQAPAAACLGTAPRHSARSSQESDPQGRRDI